MMGRVIAINDLKSIRQKLKQEKKKVVFTNGCFDIIHRGHVDYLTKAKALGDVLIVAVNTDASVRRIKGERRPIVDEDDRANIVASLSPVDYVCFFDEDTPYDLISAIVPDVLIKGADWTVDDIVGKDIVEQNGGRVATISFLPNRSTSNIIQRIVERYA
jgi:rfaE bifunctional protein nucleotidyltransferase chain/domain